MNTTILYGFQKNTQDGVSLRPVISFYEASTKIIAKLLCKFINNATNFKEKKCNRAFYTSETHWFFYDLLLNIDIKKNSYKAYIKQILF